MTISQHSWQMWEDHKCKATLVATEISSPARAIQFVAMWVWMGPIGSEILMLGLSWGYFFRRYRRDVQARGKWVAGIRLWEFKALCSPVHSVCFVLALGDVSAHLPAPAIMPAAWCHASPLLGTLRQNKLFLPQIAFGHGVFITATEKELMHSEQA